MGTSFQTVVEERQYWRLFTSQLSHIDFVHLLMNMSSLWSLGFVEKRPRMGMVYYIKVTVLLMIFSKLLLMGFYLFMVRVMKKEYYRSVLSVGYSSVIFGWMANLSVCKHGPARFSLMGTTSIPMRWSPLASVILMSVMVPRVSFFGHLSGVLVGYLIGFGYFDWFNFYWGVTMCLWIILAMIWSLVEDGRFHLPFVQFANENEIEQILIDR